MLNLLAKDFKIMFAKQGKKSKKVLSIIAEVLLFALFVALETFIFTMILKKIKNYNNAPGAFLTIFLTCVSILMIVLNIGRANKLFFNEKDIEQLINHPVSSDEIIISKLILLLITHYITSLILVYPLFISYGLIVGKTMWYYYIILFYPIFSFFFEVGIALLLVYPYKLFRDFLNKHIIAEFVTSIVIMVGLAFAYSQVLKLFMQLVTNNNLNILFSVKNINLILDIRQYLVPINFLTDIFINGYSRSLWPLISISLGVFILGLAISIFAFNYFRSYKFQEKHSKIKELKVRPVKQELLRKEFFLLFKDENYIFSFTGLLIIQPFLMYLVIDSLNKVFSTGAYVYYMTLFPAFVPILDIVIILLFTVLISSGANQYITMEKNTIKIIKTIPVSYKVQLGIKVIIPFAFSFISLVISLLVLVFTGALHIVTFAFALILSILLLAIFDAISLIEELNIKNDKPRQTLYSSLVSYGLPILFFIVSFGLSLLKLNIFIIYAIGIVIFIGLMVYLVIFLKKNLANKFMELEVVN